MARHSRAITRRREGTWPLDSVKVRTQPGVAQGNRRMVHTSTVGRP